MTQYQRQHRYKSYLPSPVLTSYVAEKILFDQFREEHNLRGQALQASRRYGALKKHKSDAIDKVFESMANLMFFFDILNRSSVLEDDLLEIAMQVTGVIRNSKYVDTLPYESPRDAFLRELLLSMVGIGGKGPSVDEFIQSSERGIPTRTVADHQILIAEIMHGISSGVFVDVAGMVLPPPADAYEPAAPFISQDIERASAWVSTMSRKARASVVDFDEKARVIDIPNLSDLVEERREKFNTEIGNNWQNS